MLKERYYVNMGSLEDYITILKYFDTLSFAFYETLFTKIIPDDHIFSSSEIQIPLLDVLTTTDVFKRYNMVGPKNMQHTYGSDDISISYILGETTVMFLKIKIGSISYERTYK